VNLSNLFFIPMGGPKAHVKLKPPWHSKKVAPAVAKNLIDSAVVKFPVLALPERLGFGTLAISPRNPH